VELYNLAESHLRALGMEERWETAVDLLLARAEAKRFLGAFVEAVKDANEAERILLDDGSDLSRAFKIQNILAELKCRQGSFEEAKKITSRMISQQDSDDLPLDELARAYQLDGFAASSLGQFDDALESLNIAEKLCIQEKNYSSMAGVLETMAFIYFMQKKLELALQAMQKSVALSRDMSTPMNVASSLSNIALIQFQLGRAADALVSIDDAIELVRDTSRNFLATALSNKAEILAYLGNFKDAEQAFDEAIDLFVAMDDQQGLLDACLLLGFEFHSVLGQWDQAHSYFEQAEKLLGTIEGENVESQVRLLIGKAQIYLHNRQLDRAKPLLITGLNLIEKNRLSWWQPAVDYFTGLLYVHMGDTGLAVKSFIAGIAAIENEGCPDYLPLIQLELARLEKETNKQRNLLLACIGSAENRARFVDLIHCYEHVGAFLADIDQEDALTVAKEYQLKAKLLKKRMKVTDFPEQMVA